MFKKKLKKIITIEGMSCNHCAKKVEITFSNLDNVSKVKVDLRKKCAILTLNENIEDNIVMDTIGNLGYQVTSISEEEK